MFVASNLETKTMVQHDGKTPTSPRATKIAQVISLLEREGGADIDEIGTATGWQKHTVRAALTGLKKKGHVVERMRTDDGSRYKITGAVTR